MGELERQSARHAEFSADLRRGYREEKRIAADLKLAEAKDKLAAEMAEARRPVRVNVSPRISVNARGGAGGSSWAEGGLAESNSNANSNADSRLDFGQIFGLLLSGGGERSALKEAPGDNILGIDDGVFGPDEHIGLHI